MELLNDTVLGIVMIIAVAAALILITAMTGQVKDKAETSPVAPTIAKLNNVFLLLLML